jgi:hypothetical protein
MSTEACRFKLVTFCLIPSWAVAAFAGLVLALVPHCSKAQQPSCPSAPRPPNLDAPVATAVPPDVCDTTNVSGTGIAFFDDYSWRVFIALVWPSLSGQRGLPDTTKTIAQDTAPLVFETYKADWETFQPNGAAPSAFDRYTGTPPCSAAKPGDFVLGSVSKFDTAGNVGEAGIGDLVSVLVSQNGKFVRYLAAYNQMEFNQIRTNQWYLTTNLPQNQNPQGPAIHFPFGSVGVKSSWIDMTNIPHPERFHTRKAWLMDPISGLCGTAPVTVGLVGLHIVQKTQSRPQWIWSTFEQIDNVPPDNYKPPTSPSPRTQTFTFNNGTSTPQPNSPPTASLWSAAIRAVPPPFNVQRLMPVNPSTSKTNRIWQDALQAKGAVWHFYQLTMTQWPVPGNMPGNPGTPQFSFPGKDPTPTSAYANTTLETWDQTNSRGQAINGCMNCHNQAGLTATDGTAMNNDFVWSLEMNASTPSAGANPRAAARSRPLLSREFPGLKTLLENQFK